jgi:hypothetical protein
LNGDPEMAPPESRQQGRNIEWQHIYSRDVISMPQTNGNIHGSQHGTWHFTCSRLRALTRSLQSLNSFCSWRMLLWHATNVP